MASRSKSPAGLHSPWPWFAPLCAGISAWSGRGIVRSVQVFREEPLIDIVRWIETAPEIVFRVLDPDRARGHYAGEIVDGCVHRPWRVWTDLAERMGLRMLTPRPADPPLVELRFERLGPRWPPRGDGSER